MSDDSPPTFLQPERRPSRRDSAAGHAQRRVSASCNNRTGEDSFPSNRRLSHEQQKVDHRRKLDFKQIKETVGSASLLGSPNCTRPSNPDFPQLGEIRESERLSSSSRNGTPQTRRPMRRFSSVAKIFPDVVPASIREGVNRMLGNEQVMSTGAGSFSRASRRRDRQIRRCSTTELQLARATEMKERVSIYTATFGRGESKTTLLLRLDSKAQHVLSWHQAIELPQIEGELPTERLEPGSCNLYQLPRVQFESQREGKSVILKGPWLRTLTLAFLSVALAEDSALLEHTDSVGAAPIHALLMANTEPAIEMVLQIMHLRPRVMLQAHFGQPFKGENALHILTVNKRQRAVCEVLELAFAGKAAPRFASDPNFTGFGRDDLQKLLCSQCKGDFFLTEPMLYYGGTPLSYAVAFSQELVITQMLTLCWKHGCEDLCDLNRSSCKLTGFLPLHVAVANGLTTMVNFLVDLPGFPSELDSRRAKRNPQTRCTGRHVAQGLGQLTPLQLAVKMGDIRMMQYILRSQSRINWKWGPVTELHLELDGIDSIGEAANDVMELVAQIGAKQETQEMLLETFMQGFLHNLFVDKWRRYGRAVHYVMRALDLVYLALLAFQAMSLKGDPGNRWNHATMPYLVMISVFPIAFEDFRTAYAWWVNFRGTRLQLDATAANDGSSTTRISRQELWALFQWVESHQMLTRLLGFLFTFVACIMLLSIDDTDGSQTDWDYGQPYDILWVPLAFALFFHTQNAARSFLAPSQTMGVFYISVFKMLSTDVTVFLFLFCIFLVNYGAAMYISYPQAGEQRLPQVVDFNHPLDALYSLVRLAFAGQDLSVDLDRGRLADLTAAEAVDFVFFLFFYLFYAIMSMILLLNLLIAMMGDTYSGTMNDSTLEWRVSFARRVLRLELESRVLKDCFGLELHAGKNIRGRWFHVYHKYTPNEEGGGIGKQAPLFSAEVEAEVEADEEDDERALGEDEGDVGSDWLRNAELASPTQPSLHGSDAAEVHGTQGRRGRSNEVLKQAVLKAQLFTTSHSGEKPPLTRFSSSGIPCVASNSAAREAASPSNVVPLVQDPDRLIPVSELATLHDQQTAEGEPGPRPPEAAHADAAPSMHEL